MAARLLALFFILVGASASWGELTGVLATRTQQADSDEQAELGALWGPEQTQSVPRLSIEQKGNWQDVSIDASTITTRLQLEQRRKGLLWHNTYLVDFAADYRIVDPGGSSPLWLEFPFPAQDAVYDDVRVLVDGKPVRFSTTRTAVTALVQPQGDRSPTITVGYRSQGIGKWSYQFGSGVSAIKNFSLTMTMNFDAIDFPPQSLAPTEETRLPAGYRLTWQYQDLVAGWGIGMVMPEQLQPGPIAERISAWAPLSLLFYFFVMLMLCTTRRIELHPMHYFFLAAAFFAFHLLFAYTVDRIPLGLAFAICSAVSMFLTISYLRVVVGWRFAAVEAALAQFFYLVLFSLALFNEGFSGLAITIGCILTLFVTMQMTARIDWNKTFATGSSRAGDPARATAPTMSSGQ